MTTPDLRPVRRALLSVTDKTGLPERARRLADLGVELVSTGGTAKLLKSAGLAVRDVSDLTGFPEMMHGRVKTLHPGVHGGLLARRDDPEHVQAMKDHNIAEIDLLVVNLYAFEKTRDSGADFETCIENIDIGGPAMLRAAAKNHEFVAVCTDGQDLDEVLAELESTGGTSAKLRRKLAARTFACTARYDAAISGWLGDQAGEDMPRQRAFGGTRNSALRYGENPHQQAAFYAWGGNEPGVGNAIQHQGKEISYNNLNDTNAAFELVSEFDPQEAAAIAIIKHANPCGVALGDGLSDAWDKALACDPVSAFGGIVAANGEIDEKLARRITSIFVEVVIAPAVSDAAKAVFAAKKNLRLLTTGALADPTRAGLEVKALTGGLLVQSRDNGRLDPTTDLKCVTKLQPTPEQMRDLFFAWKVAKHVKSNTIVYAKDGSTAGIGAGQMSRVDSARIAARKAEDAQKAGEWDQPRTVGSVAASDAFFPFADGLMVVAEAGARAIIQPGGSIRDDEVIAAANEAGLAMVFTGMRHFRH